MSRSALVAFFTSLVTSIVAFCALTVADRRGALDFLHGARTEVEAPAVNGVEVPSINGVSVEQARELLRARELLLALQSERPDPVVPAGKIAGQTPLPGSRTPRGTTVQAFLSTGASAVAIPTLVGARPDDAVEQLKTQKLVTGHRRDEASETIAAGLVMATEPPAGRSVAPGTDVTLIVSTGGAPKPIPKVLGLRVSRAKKALEEAGFKVGTTRVGSSDNYDEEVIIKQDPAANTLAPPGREVNLVVNE
jgi:serine/threonine-protein kinase